MTPSPDPLRVFEELSGLSSVTFHEYLAYKYLEQRFDALVRSVDKSRRSSMELKYTPSGLLSFRWTGLPAKRKRFVLVAHVDKEGFVILRFLEGGGRALAVFASGEKVASQWVGKPVFVTVREAKFRGRIGNLIPSEPAIVTISIDERVGEGSSELVTSDDCVGIGEFDLPPFEIDSSGVIAAPCVDNFAGVSVILSVFEAACLANWAVNIDLLFTRCEEAGFCGMVRHILTSPEDVLDPLKTWVVVDSSSKDKAILKDLPHDLRENADESTDGESQGLDLRTTVIRTGDKYSVYDRRVCQMLHAASWNARRKVALLKKGPPRSELAEEFALCRLPTPETVNPIDAATVVGARMVGGWCDASPLVLTPYLLAAVNKPTDGPRPLVGSIAIPIGNFRHTFRGEVKTEKCHVSSLLMASCLLGEAAKLDMRYPYGAAEQWLPQACASLEPERDQKVNQLLGWLKSNADLLAITEQWVAARSGSGLLARRG